MQKFHSTISRRDFMKFMAVATGGIGAAAAVTPVFHDVDELISTGATMQKRPWWVKEREEHNPTTEIDWDIMGRPNPTNTGQQTEMWAYYHGQARADAASSKGSEVDNASIAANDPGFSPRCLALKAAVTTSWSSYVSKSWVGASTSSTWTKGGGSVYKGVATPTERGEPKWNGTPEENTHMLNAYQKFVGAAVSGYGEFSTLDRTKLLCTNIKHNADKKFIIDDTVDTAYETSTALAVPGKNQMYHLVHWEHMSHELSRATPAMSGRFNSSDFVATSLKPSVFNFLRYFGYQMIGDGGDSNYPFVEVAVANLTGVCESSRQNLYGLTPELGPIGRIHSYITDMPVAPTYPIDAGQFKFCADCGKCARACPPKVISLDKGPSWDIPDINGKPNLMHHAGTKEYWSDGALCRLFRTEANGCNVCWGNCTFTTNKGAMVHEVIRGTIANVGIGPLNHFFFQMGELFNYGADSQKAEDWWDRSFPVLGMDTTVSSFDGGYKK
ncbi:reductive dehalogenase [Dehalogenimonas sp. WBC-2]|nr:reductive dehalogenase [Dehalogenimonas sp. WBC-2]